MPAPAYSLNGIDAAYALVRSRDRILLVDYIRRNPAAFVDDILEGTAIPRGSLGQHLRALEGIGVLCLDLPDNKRHGRAVRYSVDEVRTVELVGSLTQALIGRE